MPTRYYFAIKFIPEFADNALLVGRCISVMHGFTGANKIKNSIGVTFPRWDESSVGSVIGFVGESQSDLIGLSYQPYFASMKSDGIFVLTDVLPVLEDIPEVRFVRNQTIGKTFVPSKKKRINRSIIRGHSCGEDRVPISKEDREFDHFHRIPMSSQGSERDFVLHVQRQSVSDIVTGQFNSYGLATNQKWQGTVPDLTFDPFF